MKKSLLALAALTAFAGVASAQSSVTLFGVEIGVRNTARRVGARRVDGAGHRAQSVVHAHEQTIGQLH